MADEVPLVVVDAGVAPEGPHSPVGNHGVLPRVSVNRKAAGDVNGARRGNNAAAAASAPSAAAEGTMSAGNGCGGKGGCRAKERDRHSEVLSSSHLRSWNPRPFCTSSLTASSLGPSFGRGKSLFFTSCE